MKINGRYARLKEDYESFKEGDYVKIKSKVRNNKNVHGSDTNILVSAERINDNLVHSIFLKRLEIISELEMKVIKITE